MSLFNDPGSCGPSNPLQNLGKQVSGDGSQLHRDRVNPAGAGPANQFRTFRGTGNESLSRDFDAFAQGSGPSPFQPELGFQSPPIPQPQVQQHLPQAQSRGTARQPDWASQFSKMSLSQHPAQLPPAQLQHQSQNQHSHWQQGFMSRSSHESALAPNFAMAPQTAFSGFQTDGSVARMTEHQQQHHLNASAEAEQRVFSDAFDQFERELIQTQSQQQQQPMQEPMQEPKQEALQADAQAGPGEDLSGVAKVIVDTIGNGEPSRTSEKLQNSKFLNLMQQLSDKQVKLEGDKFVDGQGNEAVLTSGSSRSAEKIPEELDAPRNDEPRLPDPFDYIQQMQGRNKGKQPAAEPGEPPAEEEPDLAYNISSFEYAQNFGPSGVAQRFNWEEKYDEMLYQ